MKIQFITTTRKIVFLLIGLVIFSLEGYAQSKKITNYNPKDGIKTEWLKDFYGAGFSKANDSLYVSEESLKLLRDESYRQKMYPIIYNWNQALAFIKQQELKKAFWFLINLYPQNPKNKELVLQSIITYDSIFDMKTALTSTYYTYCFTDPQIATIVNGKPKIHSPHILEKKLQTLKEMLFYLDKYRTQDKKDNSKK